MKDQTVNILGLWILQSQFLLLNFAIVVQKQPKTIHEQMGMAVFQENFIYTNRQWARLDTQAIIWPSSATDHQDLVTVRLAEYWPPKDIHVQPPEPVNMSPYMAKRALLMWLSQWFGDRKIILDYPGGSNAITKVLTEKTEAGKLDWEKETWG